MEFPCPLCGAACRALICRGCEDDLPRLGSVCTRCGLPSPISVCIACQVNAPRWERLVAPFSFTYPIDRIIHQFKYLGSVFWRGFLSAEMARRGLALNIPLPEVLIPVPAHPRRLAERGFNQAVELARGIGRELDIPVLTDTVRRIGLHPPQVGLNAIQRRRNVCGAFSTSGRDFAVGKVGIVDDILTTGATAGELVRLLQRAGVAQVQVWVVARTPTAMRPG